MVSLIKLAGRERRPWLYFRFSVRDFIAQSVTMPRYALNCNCKVGLLSHRSSIMISLSSLEIVKRRRPMPSERRVSLLSSLGDAARQYDEPVWILLTLHVCTEFLYYLQYAYSFVLAPQYLHLALHARGYSYNRVINLSSAFFSPHANAP